MDYELRAAKEKWEREQNEKKEKARQRIERERKARDEAAARQQALEVAQRQRRLDDAAAALAARQQEEEDVREGDGVVFRKILTAVKCTRDGDKIRLPTSAFQELSGQNALDKGPMFFEVSAASARQPQEARVGPDGVESDRGSSTEGDADFRKGTHAGVLEFTAPEGFVELPSHVWLNSGLSETEEKPSVRVRYIRLPKATYAKLQPEGLDFGHVSNHKAVLETKLRQHTALSVGDLLVVQHGGFSYNLRILELKPDRQVSVLETDLEADVLPPDGSGKDSQSRLVSLPVGKPVFGVVEEEKFNYYTFVVDQKLAEAVAAGEANVTLHMEMEGEGQDADADIYVAAHPTLFPTQHQHQWSCNDLGSKTISLTSSETALAAGAYSVGVYGFRGSAKYKLQVEASVSKEGKPQGHRLSSDQRRASSSSAGPSSSNVEQCGNCKQWVAIQTKSLHEAYCWRHNVVCSHQGCGVVLRKEEMYKHVHCERCHEAFTREELEKHVKVFHEPAECQCGAVLERKEMVVHQASVCPHRLISCRFCGDMVQAGGSPEDTRDKLRGLSEHESACGSRTANCALCGRAIMLKEMDLHVAAAHSGKPAEAPGSRQSVIQSLPRSTPAEAVSAEEPLERSPSVECPICAERYSGSDAELQLNLHLDREHFFAQSRESMDVDGAPVDQPDGYSGRRSLSVSCPICGMAVHSERDLSSHIDMVH